jgi:uncharacterized repeat protein (TIGR01451 family)
VTGTDLDTTVTVTAGEQVEINIPVVVTTNLDFYGESIDNTAYFDHVTGSGSDDASFTIATSSYQVNKTVDPDSDVEPGGVVTFTVTIANNSPADATGVVMTDVLPLGVSFGGWLDQGTANPVVPTDTITWGPWDVAASQNYGFSFTATVTTSHAFLGETITNTVTYDSDNAGDGMTDAAFSIKAARVIYLPLVLSNY